MRKVIKTSRVWKRKRKFAKTENKFDVLSECSEITMLWKSLTKIDFDAEQYKCKRLA